MTTTYNGTISVSKAAQTIATSSINAAAATSALTFQNQSTTDQLVISLDGIAASPQHGFVAQPGQTINLLAIAQQLMKAAAVGAISVYGPNATHPFQIVVA